MRYTAVKVIDAPGGKPVRTKVAVAFWRLLPRRFSAVVSLPVEVLTPLIANDMYPRAAPWVVLIPAVTETSTHPDAGTVTVTAGPGVVKLV